MKKKLLASVIFYHVASIYAKEMKYWSNFKPGLIYGHESLMTDYVTIANDPVSNLPDKFTVCSSLYIDLMTTIKNVVQIYKEDGTHWFNLSFEVFDVLRMRTKSERLVLYFMKGKVILL